MAATTLSGSFPCVFWEIQDIFFIKKAKSKSFNFEDQQFNLIFQKHYDKKSKCSELKIFIEILAGDKTKFKGAKTCTFIKDLPDGNTHTQFKSIAEDPYNRFFCLWRLNENNLNACRSEHEDANQWGSVPETYLTTWRSPQKPSLNNLTFICILELQADYSDQENLLKSERVTIQKDPFYAIPHKDECLKSLSTDLQMLLEKGHESDVVLKGKDATLISAHKSILAARSEIFAAMFRSDMFEKENGIVNIDDIDGEVLQQFIHYIYTGKLLSPTIDSVMELYIAADKYAVKGCNTFLYEYLTDENALDFLQLADTCSDKELKDFVISFVIKTEKLLKTEKWIDLWENKPNLALEVYRLYVKHCVE